MLSRGDGREISSGIDIYIDIVFLDTRPIMKHIFYVTARMCTLSVEHVHGLQKQTFCVRFCNPKKKKSFCIPKKKKNGYKKERVTKKNVFGLQKKMLLTT